MSEPGKIDFTSTPETNTPAQVHHNWIGQKINNLLLDTTFKTEQQFRELAFNQNPLGLTLGHPDARHAWLATIAKAYSSGDVDLDTFMESFLGSILIFTGTNLTFNSLGQLSKNSSHNPKIEEAIGRTFEKSPLPRNE